MRAHVLLNLLYEMKRDKMPGLINSNGPGRMTKMVAKPIYGKTPLKIYSPDQDIQMMIPR